YSTGYHIRMIATRRNCGPGLRLLTGAIAGLLVALTAPANNATAQEPPRIPGADRADIWTLKLGTHATEIPVEAFTDYACGTNGGPPALALGGWTDYPKCRAESGSGYHEVYFRYDDEAEYWTKAYNLTMQTAKLTGTTLYQQPIIISALF